MLTYLIDIFIFSHFSSFSMSPKLAIKPLGLGPLHYYCYIIVIING
jgi:hypothetical protein